MSASISHKRRRGLHPAEGDGADSESEAPTGEAPPLPTPVQFGGRFEDDYELGDQLGRGTFSVVRRCIHRRSGVARAVKIIDTRRFRLSSSFRSVSVLDEVRILQSLSHPKIIRTFEVYDQALDGHDAIFIVTELASGGELFDSIIKKGNFSEPQARHVMWQVLSALEYMHSQGVIHRDLKPENVLVFSTTVVPAADPVVRAGRDCDEPLAAVTPLAAGAPPSNGSAPAAAAATSDGVPMLNVKIADFGVARYVGASAAATGAATFVGSPQYVAPEVLFAREHAGATYGRAVDVYSLGVILYVCLAGYLPFDDNAPVPPDAAAAGGPGRGTWEERVKAGRFYFAPPVWTHISPSAQDLIRHMMERDPNRRFTVSQAAAHPWFDPVRPLSAGVAAVGTGAAPTPVPRSIAIMPPAALSGGEMTPLVSEIAALGLSSPTRSTPRIEPAAAAAAALAAGKPVDQQRQLAAASPPPPPLQLRDPYAAVFYQQRKLLTSAAVPFGADLMGSASTGGRPKSGSVIAVPAAAASGPGNSSDLSLSGAGQFHNSLRWGASGEEAVMNAGSGVNGGGGGGVASAASSPVSTPMGEWQRELGLSTGAATGGSPPNAHGGGGGGGAGGGSSAEDAALERDLRILATVAKSLDFDSLLAMQRSTAATFRAAYSAVRNVPSAAAVLRKHAVSARELQLQVRKVAVRCRSLAQSILAIFPDLRDSIVDSDVGLTQSIFDRLRAWISELKAESQLMQRAYAGLIMEVQMSVETARSLSFAMHSHAVLQPQQLPREPHHHQHSLSSFSSSSSAGGGGGGPSMTGVSGGGALPPLHPSISPAPSLAATASGAGSPASRPILSPPQVGSPLLIAASGGGGGMQAGDELMDLLFDTPSVVGDERRLQRILTHFGVSSEAGHVVATRTSPAAAVIAAMQHHAGGGGSSGKAAPTATTAATPGGGGGGLEGSPGPPPMVGREPAVGSTVSLRDVKSSLIFDADMAPPSSGAQAVPAMGHAFGPPASALQQAHVQLPFVTGLAAASQQSSARQRPALGESASALQDPQQGVTVGGSTLSVLRTELDSSSSGGSSAAADGSGKCLGCALADLRRVDTVLSASVDFWTSMELVIDVAVRRKEHSETLLMHATSRRALSKATHSLQDYMAFWQAFHFLCGRYAEALQGTDLYAWLNLPEAEELALLSGPGGGGADHVHHGGGGIADSDQQLFALQPQHVGGGAWGRGLPL